MITVPTIIVTLNNKRAARLARWERARAKPEVRA